MADAYPRCHPAGLCALPKRVLVPIGLLGALQAVAGIRFVRRLPGEERTERRRFRFSVGYRAARFIRPSHVVPRQVPALGLLLVLMAVSWITINPRYRRILHHERPVPERRRVVTPKRNVAMGIVALIIMLAGRFWTILQSYGAGHLRDCSRLQACWAR